MRLFEAGDVYGSSDTGAAEHSRICLGATALAVRHDLPQGAILDKSKDSTLDLFRSFKGDVETLLTAFQHRSLTFDAQASDYYQPGLSARALIDGQVVAEFGQLHPQVAAKRKLKQDLLVAEIFADRLLKLGLREIRYTPLAKFPGVERDFSFVFANEVTFGKIEAAVNGIAVSELRSLSAVEIFRGGSIEAGKYSILLRAKFQSMDRTLREDEVAEWSAQIVSALKELGGVQRA